MRTTTNDAPIRKFLFAYSIVLPCR